MPDPIFAAIEAHRKARAALNADCSRLDEEGTPQAEAKLSQLTEAEDRAIDSLVNTQPTTMEGVLAVLRYLAEVESIPGNEWVGDYADDSDPRVSKRHGAPPQYFFHGNIANALQKLTS